MRGSGSLCQRARLVFILVLILPSWTVAQTASVPARVTEMVSAENLVTLRGSVHPLARPEYDHGAAPANLPMRRMLLVLQRGAEQEAALQKLLVEQQVKSSPNYRRWLTPEEFGRLFGPADTDLQAISDWLQMQGFQVDRVSAGRTVIEFSGTAAQVRQGFQTDIHKFVVDGRESWANTRDPRIPSALAPVVAGIASLNNFPRRPLLHRLGTFSRSKATGEVRPLFTYTDTSGTWYAVGPTDFATIYNLLPLWNGSPAIDGTGQTIAIVEQSNINLQDVRDFRSMFGLPANDPQIILNGPDPGIVPGDEGEADLDIQWAGAVARGATIQAVVSESTETSAGIDLSALYIVDNNLAPVMSESYGLCEAFLGTGGNAFYNALWEQAAAQGITVVISSGDSGSAGCDPTSATQTAAQQGLAVSGLASTPFNVAAGGTDFDDIGSFSLYWNTTNTTTFQASAKSYIPETTWNDSCAAAGQLTGCTTVSSSGNDLVAAGGGPSNCALSSACGAGAGYPKPSWQTGTGVPTDGVRDIPDVSFFASNGVGITRGGSGSFYPFCEMDQNGPSGSTSSCNLNSPYQDFQGAGGTSFSAPAFAGIMALVNQKTGARQGNANYVLYKLAAQPGASCTSDATMAPTASTSSCIFYDVNNKTSSGNNSNISVACAGGTPNCSKTTSGGYGIMVSGSIPAWTTTAGYDMATGLGTLNAANLVNNWSSVTFTPSATTLSLSPDPTTITHGQPVTVNLTVAPQTPPGPAAPTGSVALMGGPTTPLGITSFPLSGGSASGTTVSGTTVMLPGGTYNVTAHYAGDGTFGASDSAPWPVTVNPESSRTTVALVTFGSVTNPNASGAPYGSPYIVRVDVTNNSGQPCASSVAGSIESIVYPCPTGSVSLTANGGALPDQGAPSGSSSTSYALNSAGHAEDVFVQFPGGTYNLVAIYSGDSSYSGSTSPTDTITITPTITNTTLTFSPSVVTPGASVTLTAAISTSSNGGAPTGTVQFMNGGTAIGSPVPITGTSSIASTSGFASGRATLTTSFTSAATLTAVYSGDTNYATSTSPAVSVTIADFALSFSPTSLTISAPGGSGTSTTQITPSGGFGGTVSLSCTVPSTMNAATCAFNPPFVSGNGSSTLTVTTTAPSAGTGPWEWPGWLSGAALLAALLLLALPARRRRLKLAFGLVCLCLAAGAFVACGGGGGNTQHNPGTAAGTYTLTVTATSGSLTHTKNFTVTVQ